MRRAIAAALLSLAAVPTVAAAQAVRPEATYVTIDPALSPSTIAAGAPRIIYLNRHGVTLTPGPEDPAANTSSIISSTSTVTPFPYADESWQAIMKCERDMYAPYNVIITDVQPTADPYIQCIVGGTPDQAGFGSGVGGVSPFTCGPQDQSTVFTFAVFGNDPQVLCEVIAQETAHSFGLEHENYCPDPMTYRTGCGAKKFRDYDAPCGTTTTMPCQCSQHSAGTQNSVQELLAILGPGEMIPPTLTISEPADGATVAPGFSVKGMAADNYSLAAVELDIDGTFSTDTADANFALVAPTNVTPGPHTIDVIARDAAGNSVKQTLTVTVGANCTTAADCGADHVCMSGVCLGDIGLPCTMPGDCASALCLPTGQFDAICSKLCDASDSHACPSGYKCETNGGTLDKCFPDAGGGGGCAATPGAVSNLAGILGAAFGLALLLLARRPARK